MRYRVLPLERELEEVRAQRGDDAMEEARSIHVESLLRHTGFQVFVILLRDIEAEALRAIRDGNGDAADAASRIRTVDFIRKTINGIVPQKPIDWADEEFEEFLPPDIADFYEERT